MKDKGFELIFAEYHRMVAAYIYGLTGDSEDARDLMQEVFLIACRKNDQFDRTRSIAAWLRGIAWNVVANRRRKKEYRLAILDREVLEEIYLAVDKPDADEPWHERLKALDGCMEKLPDVQRKALRLFYQAGESCRQIGEKLGVLETTAFQFLWRARNNLRRCIEMGGS